MPCDTVYTTTRLDLSGMDRKLLAEALTATGWTVSASEGGITAYRYGFDLLIPRKGSAEAATLRSAEGTTAIERVQAEIRQNYGARAAQVSLARFGFKQSGAATKDTNGALRLTFRR